MNAERLTSILPQLRHYRRLKIIANFAAAGSLESVLEAATAAICRALGASGEDARRQRREILTFVTTK